jgi:hypothetical protein
MNYQQIEGQINDMMQVQKEGHIVRYVNRIIAGFSVSLDPSGMFMVGCNLFINNSGMRVAEWLYEHSR